MALPDELIREAFHAVVALAQRATVPFIVEKGDLAESFGTGTLIEANGRHFIVTAEHVARHINQFEPGIPCGGQKREIWFPGNGLVTKIAKHDVAVLRLDDDATVVRLKACWEFLTLDSVRLDMATTRTALFLHGYPTSLSPKVGAAIRAIPMSLVTSRYNGLLDDFPLGEPYDQNVDLLLDHQVKGVDDMGRLTDLPDLKGISGCSVWAVELPENESRQRIWQPRENAKIVAVQTGYKKGCWLRSKRWWVIKRIFDELATTFV